MEQYYIEGKTDTSYTLKGGYYLPELTLPAEK